MSRRNYFSKCFLYVFEFTFNPLSFTEKGSVATFHVMQAKTITFLDCLFVGEKAGNHVHHSCCHLHNHNSLVD